MFSTFSLVWLFKSILVLVENNIRYAKKIMPIIRKQATPAIKDHLIPWLTDWLNREMDKGIKEKDDCGLDFNTLMYIRDHLVKEAVKKFEIHQLTLGELEIYVKLLNILKVFL